MQGKVFWHGQWAVGSGQWAVGSLQSAVGSGQSAVSSGQWAVCSRQSAVGSLPCGGYGRQSAQRIHHGVAQSSTEFLLLHDAGGSFAFSRFCVIHYRTPRGTSAFLSAFFPSEIGG